MKQHIILLSVSLITWCSQVYAQAPVANFTMSAERCQGQEITFTNTSTNPVGSLTTHWNFGTGNPADTAIGNIVKFTYTSAGGVLPTLIVTNTGGFSDSKASNITINPTPIPAINYNIPCMPGDITFTDNSNVSGGSVNNVTWAINSLVGSSKTFVYNPGMAGNYSITLTAISDLGCIASKTESFDYGAQPKVTFSPVGPLTICQGDGVTLTAAGGATYAWYDGSTGPTKKVTNDGWYAVTAYRGNNCFQKDSIQVTNVPKPKANAGTDQNITIGQKATLIGSGGTNYEWFPTTNVADEFSSNTTATPFTTTTYILTVTDANGCSDKDSVLITVELNTSIPVHNMITPNGDGYNDKWDLSTIPNIETADVHVFNRWGWEVYKSEAYKNNWQGTYKNEPLPDGTYIYVIHFANPNQQELKGALEILRNTQK